MNQTIHCVEARDPFLRAFRAEAAARYQRMQAKRRRAEFEESVQATRRWPRLIDVCQLDVAVASSRGSS